MREWRLKVIPVNVVGILVSGPDVWAKGAVRIV